MKRALLNLLALVFALCYIFSVSAFSTDKVMNDDQKGSDLASGDLYLYGAVLLSPSESPAPQQEQEIFNKNRIRIINLGPIVNYSGLDYAPTVSADGRTLYYVSNRPGSKLNKDGKPSHDFWAARKAERLDTIFFTPFNIDTTTALGDFGVNTSFNEGAASIAADRQSLYFTACNRPDGFGDCDIYKTSIEGDKWGRPVNLGKNINSKNFDSQPAIAPDQSRLYFVSTRRGPNSNGDNKMENMDIWYSDWDSESEEWKSAENLESINTPGVDVSPFIAADNQTLFFASNGHVPNFGQQDFYVTRYNSETKKWSKPENLGEPINTSLNEQFITLPASGDIIYFSSTRSDLEGYQGNLDIFMAFVPSFFRTVLLKGAVVDKCSGENIPSTITIRNPITGKVFTDSVTISKTEFEMIVSNSDYGNPKDSIKYIDLEITAENPKYGKTSKAQRIYKPEKTTNPDDLNKPVDEIKVVLTLGQIPVIGTKIDEADYISRNKTAIPALVGFNGLVMEEVQKWDLYPLLNYVFFDLGKSDMLTRYILFNSPDDPNKAAFTDTTIAGGTLDKYYHLLNIYGFRLIKNPESKIEIVGCNDGKTAEEKTPNLSKDRAQKVYNYFRDIWRISENRMKLTYRDEPKVVSNQKDSLGIMENRRVEIWCDDWEVAKPVFNNDLATLPEPEEMKFTMKNGIEDALVVKRRIEIKHGDQLWKTLTKIGITEAETEWDWTTDKGEFPKDEVSYTAKLIVTTRNGAECESEPITIPVKQVTTRQKTVQRLSDSTLERYSLILFPFDRFDAGPLNERIMRDYVYKRIFPTSNVEVIGHTDVVGLYDHNQTLSDKRSNTVATGIDVTTKSKYAKLFKRGVGEDEPLYDNSLPEGRFYNRTVQVIIRTPIQYDEPIKEENK
jgi:outer membrane protein OmpA-like peptidoglycan-associated protein